MLKVFTRIAAFALAFGVSVSLVGLLFGFSTSTVTSVRTSVDRNVSVQIYDFLAKDVTNGRTRSYRIRSRLWHTRHRASALEEYFRDVDRYVKDSSSMDDSFMPEDLKYAWRDHMRAWGNERELLGQRLEGKVADDQFPVAYEAGSDRINETWFQVLRIAERYGVNTRNFR